MTISFRLKMIITEETCMHASSFTLNHIHSSRTVLSTPLPGVLPDWSYLVSVPLIKLYLSFICKENLSCSVPMCPPDAECYSQACSGHALFPSFGCGTSRAGPCFPPSTQPQDLALCCMPSPEPPNQRAIPPQTQSFRGTARYYCWEIIRAGCPEGEQQGWWRALERARDRWRNRSMPPKGQRQASWSHSSLQRVVAMGNSCSCTKASHMAMKLNDGDSNTTLSQPASWGTVIPWWGEPLKVNLVKRRGKVLESASTALSEPVWL